MKLAVSEAAPRQGWLDPRLALGGGTVYQVPGNHITMMAPPHVETLAQGIQACLSELPPHPQSNHKPCSSTELIQEGS